MLEIILQIGLIQITDVTQVVSSSQICIYDNLTILPHVNLTSLSVCPIPKDRQSHR